MKQMKKCIISANSWNRSVILLFLCLIGVSGWRVGQTFDTITVRKIMPIRFASQFGSLQAAIDKISDKGGGEVWLDTSVTITSTITLGQNSPSHIPVTLRILRGAVLTCSVSGKNTN